MMSFDLVNSVVIIPAHNEEKGISRTLHSLLRCPSHCDIIVVADNCTDNTAALAEKLGARVLERIEPSKKGKPYALEFALAILLKENYQWFIFVDADSVVNSNFFEEIDKRINQGAVALQVRYGLLNSDANFKQRLGKIAFSAVNYLRPLGRRYWNLSAGVFGNGFILNRQILETVSFCTDSLAEDLVYHIHLVKAGIVVDFTDGTAVWAEPPSSSSGSAKQRSRWEGGRLRAIREEVPSLIKSILAGNWRGIEPLLDLFLPPLAYYFFLLILLLILPVPFAKIYATSVLSIIVIYIVTTLILMKAEWRDWASLAIAPFYVLWKLTLIPRLFQAVRKKLSWERTER